MTHIEHVLKVKRQLFFELIAHSTPRVRIIHVLF